MSFFIPTIPPPQKTMKHLNSSLLLLHLLLLHLFFIFISQIPVSSSTPTPTPKSLQLLSLLSLKISLKDPLSSLSDWNATSISLLTNSSNPFWCSWSGIECDTKTHDIISLDLSHRNLSGSIPPQIKFLTELNYFNLSGNSFDGLLSTSIFELYQLQSLDISHNNFSGNFPLGISKFKSLKVFDAYSNSFTGSLPLEFTRLRVLKQLNLGGSYSDGGIPASYGRIPTLKYLHLAGNSLTGEIPPELGFLNQLEHLEIGYNYFNGGIPVEISLLPNLKYLDISSANLSGQLASELGNLTALESLFLFKNQFIGEIPVSFSKLVALKALDLSDNQLTGQIPEEFSSLKELTLLSLLSNNLTGKIPDFIGELPNLETLLLWNNSFTGYIPRNLGLNSKLQKLDLSSNSLSGPIPPTLCYGNKLVRLILFSNRFESQLPNSLSKCSSLWRFRIENNKLNGSIPIGFGSLPNLTYMDLSMNEFSGKIPSDLGNSVRLEYLNISKNRFEPELPENIWKASNLQIFSASFSNLNGRIPDFIGCKSLYKLELEGNDFNGSIPWDIGNCEKLLCLNLRNNSLSGIIPWELSTLPSITDIDLSHNLLSGSIPSNFDTCKTLESFNVSFNVLTGSIPSSGTIFPNLHPSSFSGNKDLCGEILKRPCFTGKFDSSDNKEDENVRFRHEQKKITGAIVWIMAVAFGIGIFILIAGSKCFQASYSRRLKSEEEDKNKSGPWKLTAFQRLNYTVDDVLECLSTSDKIIGMGSTGTVYKAEMPNGEIIAVKKLWVGSKRKETARMITMMKKGGGVKGVLAEVEVLGNVRHRNIVRLLGCIRNRESTLLLYEYMPGGSLDELLHGKSKGENNDWVIRYKIALGVAQGICYLHHDCDPVIVHRDVKPCNILLDGEMEARVADFGVAKLIQTNESMSVIAGSCGYIAPEYAYTLQVDEKSDIYSFGVVLMEILSGKKSVEAEFGEGNSIVDWVKSKIKAKDGITDILDKNAGASCTSVREEMMLVLRVALLCTSRNPADRPSMRDVVSMLHEAKPHRKTPGSLSNVNSVVVGVGDGNGGGGDDGGCLPQK